MFNHAELRLSEAESVLLNCVNTNSIVTRHSIRKNLLKVKCGRTDNALNQIIFGLRQKLKKGKSQFKIVTHKNMGYSLQPVK